MGDTSDQLIVLNLVAAGVGTVNSAWMDFSEFVAGAFYFIYTSGAGTVTPVAQISPDGGITQITASPQIPVGELPALPVQSAAACVRVPFIGPMQVPWLRISNVISVGAVTGKIIFSGRVV